jgi:phosphoribosyl 1,2-cyclic phosphate phosphodiesterase
MKILFLGTSAGWPLPRLGCDCHICQSKDPRDGRLRPAILVNDSVLVDAGPDIYHQLSRITNHQSLITNLKALILTHAHPDHILGFYDLTHLYNRKEKEPKLITTQEILNGLRQVHRFPIVPFKPEIIVPKEAMVVDDIKIAFYPVHHNHTLCYAIKMKGEKIFLYIPDLKRLPRNERKPFKGVHLLVLDGSSLGKRGQTRIHQSIEEGIRLAKDLKPKQCFFTHIGHITGTHKELEKFVQKNGGKNFHIAYDGLELTI